MGRKPVAAKALEYIISQHIVKIGGGLTDNHLAISPTADVGRVDLGGGYDYMATVAGGVWERVYT